MLPILYTYSRKGKNNDKATMVDISYMIKIFMGNVAHDDGRDFPYVLARLVSPIQLSYIQCLVNKQSMTILESLTYEKHQSYFYWGSLMNSGIHNIKTTHDIAQSGTNTILKLLLSSLL